MAKRVAFNPGEVPVLIDDQGRLLAGLSRGEVDTTSAQVKAAIETRRLVWPEKTKGDS